MILLLDLRTHYHESFYWFKRVAKVNIEDLYRGVQRHPTTKQQYKNRIQNNNEATTSTIMYFSEHRKLD